MPQLAHASLLQQCVHAGDSSSLQDTVVSDFVLPGDAQNATETAHVEYIEFRFLTGLQGPRFAAIKEGAEDAGSVYLDFGVLCQLAIGPLSLSVWTWSWLPFRCACRAPCRVRGSQGRWNPSIQSHGQHLTNDRRC